MPSSRSPSPRHQVRAVAVAHVHEELPEDGYTIVAPVPSDCWACLTPGADLRVRHHHPSSLDDAQGKPGRAAAVHQRGDLQPPDNHASDQH